MSLRIFFIMALCSLSLATAASADDDPKRGSKKGDVSKCVDVRTHVVQSAYGYDHYVHLHNGCDKTVRCEVTTNSNPEINTVILSKGESQEVVMFRGSPASQVTANTKCSAVDG